MITLITFSLDRTLVDSKNLSLQAGSKNGLIAAAVPLVECNPKY